MTEAKFIAGRNFVEGEETTSTGSFGNLTYNAGTMILTERGLRRLGVDKAADVIGKTLDMRTSMTEAMKASLGKYYQEIALQFQVVGVVEDFNLFSAYAPSYPCGIYYLKSSAWTIKYADGQKTQAIRHIRETFKQYDPENQLNMSSVEKLQNQQTRVVQQILKVFIAGAITMILISAMGLYALAASSTQGRLPEIGIRKVLGARTQGITRLLLTDQCKPVLLAMIVSLPVGFILSDGFLGYFATPISLGVSIFIGTAVVALTVAALATAGHALRAAQSDPVRTLRAES